MRKKINRLYNSSVFNSNSSKLKGCMEARAHHHGPLLASVTVDYFISAVSIFRGSVKMTNWRRLILAVMNTMSSENKQIVM